MRGFVDAFVYALVIFLSGSMGFDRVAFAVDQPAQDDQAAQEVFFETNIRPLFAKHCVECHGPGEQSGGLRLDLQTAAVKGGSSGASFVAGDPSKSAIIQAVRYSDANLQMPPDAKLKDEEIDLLVEWVRRGAYWPKDREPASAMSLPPAQRIEQIRESHWAYRPIQRLEPPNVNDPAWVLQPIDRFILEKLEAKGLKPNPKADRRSLMLRAYFTLIGLAPTFEELESFQADESPGAFERLLDRLLESKHYGERWARHWLDIARFAETTGYQAGSRDTRYPYAYTYRDYVINAFNDDKPFDQFIVEQLAADHLQLSEGDKHRLAAMGFLTVGRKFMGNPHDIIDDQIDVVTRAFLGTSVSCARCHDHKYDPIPSADYYSLYGVFASSQEPEDLPLIGDPASSPGYSEFLAAKAEKQKEIDAWVEGKRVATEHELRSRIGDYLVHYAKVLPPANPKDVKRIGDRGALRPRAASRWIDYLKSPAGQEHSIWRVFPVLQGLVGDQFKETVASGLQSGSETFSKIHPGLLDALRAAPPESMIDVAHIVGKKLEEVYSKWTELKKQDANATRLPDDRDEELRAALFAQDSPTQLTTDLMIHLLDQAERNEYNQQLGKIKTVEITHPGAPGRAMVMVDKSNLHNPAIFRRGQPGNLGDQVPRRFLQVLANVDGGKPFTKGSGRLELAEAVASPNNPLTARVIVNRIWQHQFGVGIVSTSSDFGARGELPSHPELLDFLADEFVRDGWSIKRLQKRIMMSATWQQSSQTTEPGSSIDPENRLLWRMPRRRLEFEPLRDRLLTSSDQLDRSIGGRSVMIHEDAKRRGLYAYLDREDIPGLLASFDLPSPDASQSMRARTTVPQQALFLINSKFAIQQAEALAQKTSSLTSEIDRIESLYRKTLVRKPDAQETALAQAFLREVSLRNAEPTTANQDLPVWRYGYGRVDESSGTVDWAPFPHFTGKGWQNSEAMPDSKLGYTSVTATGGHPGHDLSQCTMVRWVAPGKGLVSIEGELKHPSEKGDGVRGRVFSSRSGLAGSWIAQHNEIKTPVDSIEVEKGDIIHFVVDCRETHDHDGYQWKMRIQAKRVDDRGMEVGSVWNGPRDFDKASQGLLPTPRIDPWVQLAHVLLLSNEFAFVD